MISIFILQIPMNQSSNEMNSEDDPKMPYPYIYSINPQLISDITSRQLHNLNLQINFESSKSKDQQSLFSSQQNIVANVELNKQSSQMIRSISGQLRIFKFIKNLRTISSNVNIYTLKEEHLSLINDPTLILTKYKYQGQSLARLIQQKNIYIKYQHFATLLQQRSKDYINFLQKLPIIQPNSKLILCFDFLAYLATIFELFWVPYKISYQQSLQVAKLNHLNYSILFFNQLVVFNTGYYEEGVLIKSRKKIVLNYLNKDFILDTITILPYIIYLISGHKIFEYLQLFFLLRFIQLNNFTEKWHYAFQINELSQNIVRLINLFLNMFFMSHVVGCLWYTVGTQWIERFPMQSPYVTSLYWSVTTMLTVGYGDIFALTNDEKIYAILTMLLGCCLFAYVMNSIGGLVNEISNSKLLMKINKLNEYMENKPIDENFKIKLRKYTEQIYRQQHNDTEDILQMIDQAPEELKNEYRNQMFVRLLEKNKILQQFSIKLQNETIHLFQEISLLPNELVNKKSDLFFIENGLVEQLYNLKCKNLKIYETCRFFGEIDFILGTQNEGIFQTIGFCSLIYLNRNQFLNILKVRYEEDYHHFCYLQDSIIFNNDYHLIKQVSLILNYYLSHVICAKVQIILFLIVLRYISFQISSVFIENVVIFGNKKNLNTLKGNKPDVLQFTNFKQIFFSFQIIKVNCYYIS